jgi:hypothetical protein
VKTSPQRLLGIALVDMPALHPLSASSNQQTESTLHDLIHQCLRELSEDISMLQYVWKYTVGEKRSKTYLL